MFKSIRRTIVATVTALTLGIGGAVWATSAASAAPVAVPTCATANLGVWVNLTEGSVAAGTASFPLDFTNLSSVSCRLAGFAYVSFAKSSSGAPVGAAAAADRAVTARTLLLGAGKTAHLWLRMVATADLPAKQCRPKTVAGLLVRVPGQSATIFISHRFTTCALRVRGTDILTVEPFEAGRARAGTAQ